ncbi:MAG: T9SS type A sorting domain-containing protein, partial [Bacteroidales bacterium]|nr:T9SS type A sorting domain-containing protein [Bacteroidales bacterium]
LDNTGGLTIQYDGFTTVITLWVLVIPDETYHFAVALADVGDHIYDSGVLIEGTSFKSLGPADFLSFNFLMEHNPELSFDIIGEMINDEVHLEIPPGVNITSLIADFEVRGVEVFVDEVLQETGITPNNFTQPVEYFLMGYEHKDWTVIVDVVTDIVHHQLQSVISPNPSVGKIQIENMEGINVKVYGLLGNLMENYPATMGKNIIVIDDLPEGLYLVELEKEGKTEIRKVIVN